MHWRNSRLAHNTGRHIPHLMYYFFTYSIYPVSHGFTGDPLFWETTFCHSFTRFHASHQDRINQRRPRHSQQRENNIVQACQGGRLMSCLAPSRGVADIWPEGNHGIEWEPTFGLQRWERYASQRRNERGQRDRSGCANDVQNIV